MKYIKLTDIIHFVLGVAAIKTNLAMPITILFGLYEAVDTWIQVKAKCLLYFEERQHEKIYHLERILDILNEKKELRKDVGVFILGLVIASLF